MSSSRPKRVMFVCIGNSCRSQMAEGFARAYGMDVMAPESSGLSPAQSVARGTVRTMAAKNIDISAQFPKPFEPALASEFDLIINMSGFELPGELQARTRDWDVLDPIGQSAEVYRHVCDEIEVLVMDLISELRREQTP
ncbi:MAG: low molecular weight phosphatase family protein [Candidatus Solibacter usitatus]|nr:low molecular weight phosphatase family protein [Candidatus Solibacter usitatus]